MNLFDEILRGQGAPGGGGGSNAIDLTINAEKKTYECDMALSELFSKIKEEGWGVCNLVLKSNSSTTSPSYIVPYKISSYFPNWIKVFYFSFEKLASGGTAYIKPKALMLEVNGTVTIENEATFTGELPSQES